MEERFEFKIEIGGGWGRAGGSAQVALSQNTLTYARDATLRIETPVEAPWGGRVELYFNGIRVAEGNPLSGAWSVGRYLSGSNTIAVEIVAPLGFYWVGGTVVYGVLSVLCEYPDRTTAESAKSENEALARTYAPAGPTGYAQSPWAGFAEMLAGFQYVLPPIIGLALMITILRMFRGD